MTCRRAPALAALAVAALLAACAQAPREADRAAAEARMAPPANSSGWMAQRSRSRTPMAPSRPRPPLSSPSAVARPPLSARPPSTRPAVEPAPVRPATPPAAAPAPAATAPAAAPVPAPAPRARPAAGTTLDGEYRIGVDDTVQISVWRNPELSVQVPVRPDGFISAPLIGDIKAGGLTAEQVAANIEVELEKFIRHPQVSVILTNLVSHAYLTRVRVTGAVEQPVSLAYRQGMTVLDLVLEAGGLNDFAAPAKSRLYSKNPTTGESDSRKVRLDKIINKGDLRTNFELAPGDVLTIPERRF